MNGRLLIAFFLALMFVSAIGLGMMPGNLLVDTASEFAFVAAVIGLIAADAVTLLGSLRGEDGVGPNWREGVRQLDSDNPGPTVRMSSLLAKAPQAVFSSQGAATTEHSESL